MKNSDNRGRRWTGVFSLVFIFLLGVVFNADAEKLSKVSNFTKNDQPEVYASIESFAVAKWENDKNKQIHEINEQIRSMALLLLYDEIDQGVFFSIISSCSRKGEAEHNIEIFDTAETYADIRTLVVDWKKLKEEYDKKVGHISVSL